MATPQEAKDFALYNGVSNRSRGWKSRKPGESIEPQAVGHMGIKRWDGKTKTSMAWDGLRRDPELWFRNGNCFVHLYARGQSRRGPAFKLPLSTLLAAQCHPLIERFLAQDIPPPFSASDGHSSGLLQPMPTPPPLATLDYWSRAHLLGRVDLYIPPPPDADKDEVYSYYLAVRNLFAWIFRRAVVGEHLGSTLAGLFSAMREFRQPNVDNVQDLMCYLEDEGYLVVSGRPEYALALLHLAEAMSLRELYVNSFAHCVGMYNDLFVGTEYQYVSAASRKSIRRARLDMDLRLGFAGSMLADLFETELSETNLGLPPPSRAHLDRFRAFIYDYYTTCFGYYPPVSIDARSIIFEPQVYRLLAYDFQALYEYLVDKSFRTGSTASPLSQSGFCVLQTIQAFDARHNFPPLEHPLSLLPDTSAQPLTTPSTHTVADSNGLLGVPTHMPKRSLSSRRVSWFGSKKMDKLLVTCAEKLKPDTRLIANTSLLKATNKLQPDLAHSSFVAAYRQFEEDSVFRPQKADRVDKTSLIEARKVRWILVYAIHQTLQKCLIPPPDEVTSTDTVPYHVSISAKSIPQWKDSEIGLEPVSPSYFNSPPVSPTSGLPSLHTLTNAFTFPLIQDAALEPHTPTRRNEMSYGYDSQTLSITPPPPARCMSMTAVPDSQQLDNILMVSNRGSTASPVFDFRPDIDYLGLANRNEPTSLDGEVEVVMLPRSRSLTRTLSQKAAFRRSMSLFRGNSSYSTTLEPPSPTTRPSKGGKHAETGAVSKSEPSSLHNSFRLKRNSLLLRSLSQTKSEDKAKEKPSSSERRASQYHEIVVHGYGNGTNPVQLTVTTTMADHPSQHTPGNKDNKDGTEEGVSPSTSLNDSVTTPSTTRSLSTSSTNSNTSAATAETALTALTEASPTISISCPVLPRTDSATDFLGGTAGLSRSSSVYSSTPCSCSIAASRASSFVGAEAPAIPPRARPAQSQSQSLAPKQPLPTAASVSRSSSVYSTASMLDDVLAASGGGARPMVTSTSSPLLMSSMQMQMQTLPPPPVPVRSSARHRRFSVYGGGDEYARIIMPMTTESKVQTQSLFANQAAASGGQRFDMVQEALEAVRETRKQHQMPGSGSSSIQVSRTSSFVGVAALRCVNEDDELAMGAATASDRRRLRRQTIAQPPVARSRRSSYFGLRDESSSHSRSRSHSYDNNNNNDDDDDDLYMDLALRGPGQDEHPEWDKFASLGGHTFV